MHKPSTGRFARTKHRSGHVGTEAVARQRESYTYFHNLAIFFSFFTIGMLTSQIICILYYICGFMDFTAFLKLFFFLSRCFITAGSPALPPSRSRIVEAIIIHLLDKFPSSKTARASDGRNITFSRWRLILAAYMKIRARLLNSHDLLSSTGLTLFNLNEAQISLWFKNKTRREEVTMLLQGRALPGGVAIATTPLPVPRPLKRHLTSAEPVTYSDPTDRAGKAKIRKRAGKPSSRAPKSSAATVTPAAAAVPQSAMPVSAPPQVSSSPVSILSSEDDLPRTTAWRHQKLLEEGRTIRDRKTYSCRLCKQPTASEGHFQYYGFRYCPNVPDAPQPEVWKAAKRKEREDRLLEQLNRRT